MWLLENGAIIMQLTGRSKESLAQRTLLALRCRADCSPYPDKPEGSIPTAIPGLRCFRLCVKGGAGGGDTLQRWQAIVLVARFTMPFAFANHGQWLATPTCVTVQPCRVAVNYPVVWDVGSDDGTGTHHSEAADGYPRPSGLMARGVLSLVRMTPGPRNTPSSTVTPL
jgi:hypothetical protein